MYIAATLISYLNLPHNYTCMVTASEFGGRERVMLDRLAKSVVSCSPGSPTPHAPCDPHAVLGPGLDGFGRWGCSVDSRRTSFKMRVMFSSVSRLMLTTARYDPRKRQCHLIGQTWRACIDTRCPSFVTNSVKQHTYKHVLSSPRSFPFPVF